MLVIGVVAVFGKSTGRYVDRREPFIRKEVKRAALNKYYSVNKIDVIIWYADHVKRLFETICTNFEAKSLDIPFGQGLVAKCLRQETVYTTSIIDYEAKPYHLDLAKARSWVCFFIKPVIATDSVIGAIGFYSSERFDPDPVLSKFDFAYVKLALFCLDTIRDAVSRDEQINKSLLSLDIGRVAEDRFHDIEEQLFGAIGAIGAIRSSKSIDPSSNIYKHALLAEAQVKKASEFTKKYLQEAKNPDYLNTKETDVNGVVRKIAREADARARMRKASRGHAIDIRPYLSDLPLVCDIDVERIYRCLTNIVINAEYWVLRSEDHTRRIDITTDSKDGFAIIRIRDTGPGLTDLKKVFDAGYSLRGGTGLGLSIAQRVIRLHNGSIEATSEPRRWACFQIMLPLVQNKAGASLPGKGA